MKSTRNKTIDTAVEDGREYLERCISVSSPVSAEEVTDKTILGDTFEVLPLLPRGLAKLIIADPPYNLNKDFHGCKFRSTDSEAYERYTEEWVRLVKPLLKPNGAMYVCCDWQSGMVIGAVLQRHFTIMNRITSQREKGRGSRKNWKNSMEDIWYVTNGKAHTFNADDVKIRRRVIAPYRVDGKPKDWEETPEGNFRDTYPSNFWDDISVPYWSMPENTAHPTQKPEKLLAKLILASSDPGDLVLDPFLGSGSTSVAAKKAGITSGSSRTSATACGLSSGSPSPRTTGASRAMRTGYSSTETPEDKQFDITKRSDR